MPGAQCWRVAAFLGEWQAKEANRRGVAGEAWESSPVVTCGQKTERSSPCRVADREKLNALEALARNYSDELHFAQKGGL